MLGEDCEFVRYCNRMCDRVTVCMYEGILISRRIFDRIRNFLTYRIAATLQLVVFFFIAVFAFRPIDDMPLNWCVSTLCMYCMVRVRVRVMHCTYVCTVCMKGCV
jgi:hypothetical protein